MGIRLDWEIEAEQAHIQRAGEDAETARQRRVGRLRLLMFIGGVLLILVGIAAAVVWRLRAVDEQIQGMLRNTVDAEITALRIGDALAFAEAQRSASNDWLMRQEQTFDAYQQLKLEREIQLTGQILDMTVEEQRARVEVQEIIDGIPYSQIWFYWRYDDGWRHVPPDYTFWGEVRTDDGENISLRYQAVDADLAAAMGQKIGAWLTQGCEALGCGQAPFVRVEILPDEALQVSWSAADAWTLQVPSPYVRRARSDMPFDLELQFGVASLLAERLIIVTAPNFQPVYPSDAYYLRQAAVSWLVGKFVQLDTNAFIIDSLAQNYGEAAVGRLLQAIQPESNVSVLGQVTGVPTLDQAKLDWRDFLTWRLTVEDQLIGRRDEVNFLNLYDTRDENARRLASQRFSALPETGQKVVVSAPLETGPDGAPLLRALVGVKAGDITSQAEALFRLVDGVWRRVN